MDPSPGVANICYFGVERNGAIGIGQRPVELTLLGISPGSAIEGKCTSRIDLDDLVARSIRWSWIASLEYVSPESWGTLPTFDSPNEESPTKSVLQVALNQDGSCVRS
jgi:hypothetical protein